MRIEYHPEAEEELNEAAVYYERAEEGLGVRFRKKYQEALRRVQRNPSTFREVYHDVRKLNLARFPYGIAYLVRGETIYILAVIHLHRKPFYWKDRAG